MTYLFVRGLDPIELDENFNLVRSRINQALTGTNHQGEKANDKTRVRPLNVLTFKTAAGGRIAVSPEYVAGVGSDEAKDGDED